MTANKLSANGSHSRTRACAEPSTAEHNYWRDPDGQRSGFSELAAGRDPDQVRELAELHVRAICALLRAGFAAQTGGEQGDARRLFAGASRLCTEPLGHWPAAAMRSDQ